jgi:hypothetical protein
MCSEDDSKTYGALKAAIAASVLMKFQLTKREQ